MSRPSTYSDITRKVEERFVLSLWHGVIDRGPRYGRPSMRAIALSVADKHGVELDELVGPCAARRTAWPRQEAMWLIRQRTTLSLPVIGAFFNRDHTTVLHGIRAHEARRQLAKLAA